MEHRLNTVRDSLALGSGRKWNTPLGARSYWSQCPGHLTFSDEADCAKNIEIADDDKTPVTAHEDTPRPLKPQQEDIDRYDWGPIDDRQDAGDQQTRVWPRSLPAQNAQPSGVTTERQLDDSQVDGSIRPWVIVIPKLEQAIANYATRTGHAPDDADIAREMGLTTRSFYRMLSLLGEFRFASLSSAREELVNTVGAVARNRTLDDRRLHCLRYEMQEFFGDAVHFLPSDERMRISFFYTDHGLSESVTLCFCLNGSSPADPDSSVSICSGTPEAITNWLGDEPLPHDIYTRVNVRGGLPRGPLWEGLGKSASCDRDVYSWYWFGVDQKVIHRSRDDRYFFKVLTEQSA
jgi:hypothetical protein